MASGSPPVANPLKLRVYKGHRWNTHETWDNRGHRAPADWTYGYTAETLMNTGVSKDYTLGNPIFF